MSVSSHSRIPQAVWFLMVGALAAAVHFFALLALVKWGGVAPAWGNVWAFALAFCVSFGGHFRLTFRHSRHSWLGSLWRWLASSAGGFLLNQFLFVLGLHWLGERHYAVIWLAVTLLVTLLTFSLGKFWAFRQADTHP